MAKRVIEIIILISALLFTACKVYIVYPTNSSSVVGTQTDIRVKYLYEENAQFSAVLNDQDITDLFVYSEPDEYGWVLASAINVPIANGENHLSVSVNYNGNLESDESYFNSIDFPDATGLVDTSGECDGFVKLDYDEFSLPHISYYNSEQGGLMYSRYIAGYGFANIPFLVISNNEFGHFNDIVVTEDFNAYIAYFEEGEDFGSLKLLHYQDYIYNFEIITIDEGENLVVGKYVDMVKLEDGTLLLAYYDETNANLKVAFVDSENITVETLDGDEETRVGKWPSIAIANDGKIGIAYYDETNHALRYAEFYELPANIEIVDAGGNSWVGSDVSLGFLSDGRPVMAYFDETDLDLKFAYRDSQGDFVTSTIRNEGVTGMFNSLVIDSNDNVYISFYDLSNKALMLAFSSDLQNFDFQVIDDGGGEEVDVGRYTSMKLDAYGYLGIAYLDATNQNIKFVRINTTGLFKGGN